MSLQKHLYNKCTISEVLEAYIKDLSTGNIEDKLHANKLKSYENTISNHEYVKNLRNFFNETYDLLDKRHPELCFSIAGRRKSLISVEKKILQYSLIGKSLDLIRDFYAFRIILFGSEEINLIKHCYSVIENIIDFAATKGFTPCDRLPLIDAASLDVHNNEYFSQFKYKEYIKDYICFPKKNGYQSIHLVLVDIDGRYLEIQVRTLDMHYFNQYGDASHVKYKENKSLIDIPLDRSKIKINGYKDQLLDLSGVEESLTIFQRQKTF